MKRALVAVMILATACGRSSADHSTLTVFAAASLTGAFTDLGRQFRDQTNTNVTFNFAASSTLARQIADGSEADVFASAAEQDLDSLVAHHLAGKPSVFARNTLEIAVPKDNPKRVGGLADLGAAGATVVLCASSVPCGRLADAVLARAGVKPRTVSREDNVKAVLTKVALGEADAGLVYVSDVKTAPAGVRGIPIPAAQNAMTGYPIAVLSHSRHASAAESFVGFVLSDAGRKTLARYGFAAP